MNRDFIYNIPEKVLLDNSLTLADIRIYSIIRSFMDTTGIAFPSNNWIANKLQIDRRSAIRCISRLTEKGYLVKKEVNGKRYLSISVTPIEEQLVTFQSPPSDISVTPPSDISVTILDQSIINTKEINTLVRTADESELEVKSSPKQKIVTPENYQTHPLFKLYQKFYSQYPKHEQPYAGFRAFFKLKPTDELVEKLIADVQERFKGIEWKFVPLPASYLNGRHWEGEISCPAQQQYAHYIQQNQPKFQQSQPVSTEIAEKRKKREMDTLQRLRDMADNKPSEGQRNYGIQAIRSIKDILATS